MNRSDIDLSANASTGQNVGDGIAIFKGKVMSGNTLQFKTLKVTGSSLVIITGETTITISGGSGGGGSVSGATGYIPRFKTGGGVESSSIYDSGATRICILKDNIIVGDPSTTNAVLKAHDLVGYSSNLIIKTGCNLSDGCGGQLYLDPGAGVPYHCVFIGSPSHPDPNVFIAPAGTTTNMSIYLKSKGNGQVGLWGDGGIVLGNSTIARYICSDGSTLCSYSNHDLCVGAFDNSGAGGNGTSLCLNGGNAVNATGNGGCVILRAGTTTGSGNAGRIRMLNLPNKTTETCAVYIDASGNLSKSIVGTGSTTITGTANYVAKFNSTGNNVINSSICDAGTTEINILKDCITLGCVTSTSTCLRAHNHATQTVDLVVSPGTNLTSTNTGFLFLDAGKSPVPTIYLGSTTFAGSQVQLKPFGVPSNIMLVLCSKGSERLGLFSDQGIEFGKPSDWMCYNGNCLYKTSQQNFCILGQDNNNVGANACSLYLRGGDAVNSSSTGGNLILRAGLGTSVTGRTYVCNLPSKTSETCAVFIDSIGRLSTGVPAGGGGGIAVTGATNGVCLYNSKNVCLGGLLTTPLLLCSTNTSNNMTFCAITTDTNCNNKTIIDGGYLTSCVIKAVASTCTYLENCGSQITLNAANYSSACNNQIVISPNMAVLTVNGATNTGFQYAADYTTKFNANARAIPDVGWSKNCFNNCTTWRRNAGALIPISGDSVLIGNAKYYCWANGTYMVSSSGGSSTTWCARTTNGNISISLSGGITAQSGVGFAVADSTYTNYVQYTPVGEILNPTGNLNMSPKPKNDGTKACYIRMCGGQNSSSGLGGDICLIGGSSTLGTGGNVYIDVANSAGANKGCAYICGLQSKTTESCAIFIDAAGKLVTGTIPPVFGWSNLTNGTTVVGCGTVASGGTIVCNTFIGVQAGAGITSGYGNVGVGYQALCKTTTGYYNVGVGYQALLKNTTGNQNVGIGFQALCSNTTGSANVAIGIGALTNNVTGTTNVAIGNSALYFNTTGYNNIGVGPTSLYYNTSGHDNNAMGYGSLYNNMSGNHNIAHGYLTLNQNTIGLDNIAHGACALQFNTSGCNNIATGCKALYNNTTGCNNIAQGCRALEANTTGSDNMAFGNASLWKNTSGNCNIAFGCMSLYNNLTGIQNIGLGVQTLMANTSGNYNIALGFTTLGSNTIGGSNIGIGISSLFANTIGNRNISLGDATMQGNISGNDNVALGYASIYSNTTGSYNIGLGYQALRSNTTGNNNIAFGNYSLFNNTTGGDSIAIGDQALRTSTSVSPNIALGKCSLYANTSGYFNVALGDFSLVKNTTGAWNFAVGYQALCSNTTGTANIAIGYQSMKANLTGQQNIALGYGSLCANTTGGDNVALGFFSFYSNTTGGNNVGIGNGVMQNNTTGCHNVGIGGSSMQFTTTGSFNTAVGVGTLARNCAQNYNTALGYYAAYQISGGTSNVAVGFQALMSNATGVARTGSYNTGVGHQVLYNLSTGSNNVAVGCMALCGNLSGSDNVAIGERALQTNTTGGYNIAAGYYALNKNTTGGSNIGIGLQAIMNGATGGNNIGIGTGALRESNGAANIGIGNNALLCSTTGNYNIAIGSGTMQGPSAPITGGDNIALGNAALANDTSGAWNIAIGYMSMMKNTTGIHNTAMGYQTLYNNIAGQCNVAIGYTAGSGETNSGRLHIANKSTSSLIYGEFDTPMVKICGTLCSSARMCAVAFDLISDRRLKTNIETLSVAPINVEYKQFELICEPNQIRYGVIAQELQEVNPELVSEGSDGLLGVNYTDLLVREVAYLKCEIKELKLIVNELRKT